ncbi:nitroreductase [Pseudoclavibacter endophyticus]|uniref:Nitroreductase n=1 Tax=Pseudoclavibacter endophyticus TaxID=1778590 RepID=A0A6H9WQG0_9MICO|nr:nitroreductase family protein [Pseudoclavibacter endophyticus]KAB1649025.1 nitroreductase [Pseudoclavibacter endophyticus]GGA66133.1 nitroreductase [Pseudoclavibacter endophyticus]
MTTSQLQWAEPTEIRNPTSAPIAPLLAARWSPKGFDPTHVLSDEQLTSIVEAARWAPSMQNSQPWRFIVGRRGTETFAKIENGLMAFNQGWTSRASALVVFCRTPVSADGKTLPYADYDLGQAAAHFTVQAAKLGLSLRQMGGANLAAIAESFALPESIAPKSVAALGVYSDDAGSIDEKTRQADAAERTRLPLDELFAVPAE